MSAPGVISSIQFVEIARLRPDPDNARARTDRGIAAIAESLDRFGQLKPVVVTPDFTVIAGNGTLAAAQKLGWKQLLCAVTDLEPEQLRAYAIADNRTSELSYWDEEQLINALGSIEDRDTFSATGFTEDDLAAMRRAAKTDDERDADAGTGSTQTGNGDGAEEPDTGAIHVVSVQLGSKERADFVASVLVSAGVDPQTIKVKTKTPAKK